MSSQNNPRFSLWKALLIPIFIFVALHFFKDITQDLLGVPTVLDLMGDVNEDLSNFHPYALWVYHWFMVNTIILEVFLVVIIPKTWLRKNFAKVDLLTLFSVLYLFAALFVAYLLDPGI